MSLLPSKVKVFSFVLLIGLLAVAGLVPAFGQQTTFPEVQEDHPIVEVYNHVDKTLAYVQDELVYDVYFTLTHAVDDQNVHVRLADPIPLGTEYVPDSVSGAVFDGTTISASVYLDLDPVTTGTLPMHHVSFRVRIVDFPASGQVNSLATITDIADPGTVPTASDEAITTVQARVFIPLILKNYQP